MPTVAELLTASRAAHARKQRASGIADKHGQVISQPNYPQAEAHIAEALRIRLEAEALDPMFTDPAWSQDRVSHTTLVEFYQRYPSIT